MNIIKTKIISKVHLIISVIIVVPAAFIYGFDLNSFLNLSPHSVDQQNFFKAVMGLYIGFSILWILGIFKVNLLKPALISNAIFMCGLALGRLLSIILDDLPSTAYIFGTIGEFILGFYGLWVLYSEHQRTTNT